MTTVGIEHADAARAARRDDDRRRHDLVGRTDAVDADHRFVGLTGVRDAAAQNAQGGPPGSPFGPCGRASPFGPCGPGSPLAPGLLLHLWRPALLRSGFPLRTLWPWLAFSPRAPASPLAPCGPDSPRGAGFALRPPIAGLTFRPAHTRRPGSPRGPMARARPFRPRPARRCEARERSFESVNSGRRFRSRVRGSGSALRRPARRSDRGHRCRGRVERHAHDGTSRQSQEPGSP